MKKIILIALAILLCACGKTVKTIKVDGECLSIPNVKCKAMVLDAAIESENMILEELESKKSKAKRCKREEVYNEAIQLSKQKIAFFESMNPNFLKRFFLAGWTTDFYPLSDELNAQYIKALQAVNNCENAAAPAPASVPEKANSEPVPAGPLTTIAPPSAPASEHGTLDSNAEDLPKTLNTVAGVLTRTESPDNPSRVTLNGKAIFSGLDAQWQFPVRSFKLLDGSDAILMASSGGRGNSCETLFFFLIASASGVRNTSEFGTCSAKGEYQQTGNKITLTLPNMGGKSEVVFDGNSVIEEGKLLKLDDSNDPSK